MRFLKKSIKTIEIGLYNSIVYKDNFIMGFVSSVANLIVQLVFWPIYYNSGANLTYVSIDSIMIAGYSLKEMMTYSVVIYIIQRTISLTSISNIIKEDIMSGELNIYLLRPMEYLWTKWLQSMSKQALNLVLTIIFLFVVHISFDSFFVYPESLIKVFITLFFVVLACILSFLLNSIIGVLAFWLLETQSLGVLYNMMVTVLSGSLFPINLIKNQFGNIIKCLPFSYMAFIPAQIYLEKIENMKIVNNILICLFWVVMLLFLLIRLWNNGIRKYSAFGG